VETVASPLTPRCFGGEQTAPLSGTAQPHHCCVGLLPRNHDRISLIADRPFLESPTHRLYHCSLNPLKAVMAQVTNFDRKFVPSISRRANCCGKPRCRSQQCTPATYESMDRQYVVIAAAVAKILSKLGRVYAVALPRSASATKSRTPIQLAGASLHLFRNPARNCCNPFPRRDAMDSANQPVSDPGIPASCL